MVPDPDLSVLITFAVSSVLSVIQIALALPGRQLALREIAARRRRKKRSPRP